MKIVVLTLGSRGDVQPYVALGKEMVKRGHEVTICTGGSFEKFVKSNGLQFYKASIDFMEIVKTDAGNAVVNGGGNIFKTLKFVKEVINPGFRKTLSDFYQVTKGSDLIIYHPKALMAVDLAEHLNIPCISMPPVPMTYPITEFPNLAVSAKGNFGAYLNKLTYKVVKYGESASIKDINRFRVDVMKVQKRKVGALNSEVNGKAIPIIYPISPSLFEDVVSWNGHVEVTGFFYMDLKCVSLDEKIESFIKKGQKPIIISFSSMPLDDPEHFKNIIIESLKKTANRAIVLVGASGMDFGNHDNILAIEKAPHRLLFKAGKGIVHHGGVGTTAEALLSGAPQVIMPFNVDQPFWAHRLFNQGYALKPLDRKKLTVESLVDAFEDFDSQGTKDKASEISLKLSKENGILKAADYIESEFANA